MSAVSGYVDARAVSRMPPRKAKRAKVVIHLSRAPRNEPDAPADGRDDVFWSNNNIMSEW